MQVMVVSQWKWWPWTVPVTTWTILLGRRISLRQFMVNLAIVFNENRQPKEEARDEKLRKENSKFSRL